MEGMNIQRFILLLQVIFIKGSVKFSVDITNKRTSNFMGVLHFIYIGLIQLKPHYCGSLVSRCLFGFRAVGEGLAFLRGNWRASSGKPCGVSPSSFSRGSLTLPQRPLPYMFLEITFAISSFLYARNAQEYKHPRHPL